MRHRKRGTLLYDYLEERLLGARTGIRRRNVPARVTEPLSVVDHRLSATYAWWKANYLEGRVDVEASSGVWPISDLRVGRFFGRPSERICPQGSRPESWPADVDLSAKRNREHHYFRVRNAAESIRLLSLLQPVVLSLQITPDWFDPSQGVIRPLLSPPDFCGTHCVALTSFEAERDCFAFPNSWGEEWGDGGWGYLSRASFDKSIIEAWASPGPGCVAPVKARFGATQLLWKWSLTPEFGVHGQEVVDAASGDRLAWSFAVRRGEFLDVEEMFVWPDFRGKGYGRALADMLRELSARMGTRLRMWVPFADCEADSRESLFAAARMLGVELHASPERWAGYVALDRKRTHPLPEVRLPPRPASAREELTAYRYDVWYGTNRAPLDPLDVAKGFGSDRSRDVDYGRCEVIVPKSHLFGSVGSAWWKRLARASDDRLRLVANQGMPEADFWADIRREIEATDGS